MKKLATAMLLSACMSAPLSAHVVTDTPKVFKGDRGYLSFCRAVVEDNVRLLNSSFKNKIGVVATNKKEVVKALMDSENLSCNGKGIMEFSKEREATQVLAYLQRASNDL